MKQLASKLSEFFQSNSIYNLLLSSVSVQILSVLTMPLILRIHSVEDYGKFSIFTNFLALPTSLITLKFENAVFQCKKKEEIYPLLKLCLFLIFAISCISCLLFLVCHTNNLFGIDHLPIWSFGFIFLILIGTGITSILRVLLVYGHDFMQLSWMQFSRQLVNVVSKIFGGIINGGFLSLITAELLALVTARKYAIKYNLFTGLTFGSIFNVSLFSVFKKWRSFILFEVPSTLIDALVSTMPIFYIAHVFEPSDVAIFSLSYSIVFMASRHVGYSISEVFRGKFSSLYREGKFIFARKMFVEVFIKLVLASILILLAFYTFVPTVVVYAFGSNWKPTAEIFRLMIPWASLSLITSSLSPIFTIMKMQQWKLVYDLSSFLFLLIMLNLFTYNSLQDFTKSVVYANVFSNVIYLFLYYFIYKKISRCVE